MPDQPEITVIVPLYNELDDGSCDNYFELVKNLNTNDSSVRGISLFGNFVHQVVLPGGIQLLSLGIIGEYLARIFNESKARPLYFIKDQAG
jgi:hypothetical protein